MNQVFVESVVNLARVSGSKTIAEYVGDHETLELLRSYGVDYAQGFHLGRPKLLEGLPSRSEERPRLPELSLPEVSVS